MRALQLLDSNSTPERKRLRELVKVYHHSRMIPSRVVRITAKEGEDMARRRLLLKMSRMGIVNEPMYLINIWPQIGWSDRNKIKLFENICIHDRVHPIANF
mmetsp:Transcript_65536/g.77594  ORF Transcript_65536/g.77594 Transcript_65536/m.77594 type:complete len:101 (+) Transcript_65536:446-748(+)